MYRIRELFQEIFRRMIHSRLLPLFLVITLLLSALIYRLFQLQIIEADSYQEEYISKIEDTIVLEATRGNIYDRNGKLLAYNELTYSVTFQDVDAYTTQRAKNNAVLEIVRLLDEYGETIVSDIPIGVDEDGRLQFTASSDSSLRRFIRELYGTDKISSMLETDGIDAYEQTAEEVFEYLREYYYFSSWKDENGELVEVDYETQLKVLAIRYSLTQSAYTKYQAVTVATNVSTATVAAVMEHSAYIEGLGVEEDSTRVYADSIYFSHIIGYTGKASAEDLETLQESDESYSIGDIVGRTGIESVMELELHGTKGSQEIYKDSQGRILEVISTEEPTVGNDVYLTIDSDMQIGIYHLLEQMIAGILVNYIVSYDYVADGSDSKPPIPVKDVYFALIDNNVLSISDFDGETAGASERQMYAEFSNRLETVSDTVYAELTSASPTAYEDLPDAYQDYMTYIYSNILITSLGIIDAGAVDTEAETYLAWKSGAISLRELIYYAINVGWIDTASLSSEELYSSTDEIYEQIVAAVMDELQNTTAFHKKIYEELIQNEVITGSQLCLALFDQQVLEMDETAYAALQANDAQTAFDFIVSKIQSLEITPAQLALDPCSGAVVVTDVNTGEVLSLVSYPSYDNNEMSGSVDPDYWQQLQNDLSTPLLCRATQTTIAPGSTYKMISAIAGLEEGIIDIDTSVDCTGVYEKVTPNPTCWIGEPGHGTISVVGALAQSCNSFFYDIGYSLSTGSGTFSETEGLSTLAKYAAMFGLDTISGVEMSERQPTVSYEEPVASAIGQGKNSYATVQLARYVTALASGNLYELSLLDKVCDSDGNTVEEYTPELVEEIELDSSTWDIVREGMYAVTHYGGGFVGTVSSHMADCVVDVAGKTGSAQQDKTRSEHAQFVSYAPYDDPEIAVTITIPNGYASGYCAYLAVEIYNYIYGETTLDEIIGQDAYSIGGNSETSD